MFAVVATGGKQYRVSIGQSIDVEMLPGRKGERIEFDRVLMVGDGDRVTAGTPTVAGASVVATVSRQFRGPKLVSFRYKSKKRVRVKRGHRQDLTQLFIRDIVVNGESAAERERAAAPSVEPAAATAEAVAPVSPAIESAAPTDVAAAPAGTAGPTVPVVGEPTPTAREANADELAGPVDRTDEGALPVGEAAPATGGSAAPATGGAGSSEAGTATLPPGPGAVPPADEEGA